MTSASCTRTSVRDAVRILALTVLLAWQNSSYADAASVVKQNLADLITQSELILLGTVERVSDGFTKQGIPYTEITMNVTESLKGDKTPVYRFRQFGLMESRASSTGQDYLGMSPQGSPRWFAGESVLVFLHQPARHTGLQATVGMGEGKLEEVGGRFERNGGIQSLFQNLVVEVSDLTPDQIDMLRGDAQVVESSSLLALLRRAVDENWVENGKMHHAE
jgi:hypothetical protein